MLKYYITDSFDNLRKLQIGFFYLSSPNENLETLQIWFELLKELKQFSGTFTG